MLHWNMSDGLLLHQFFSQTTHTTVIRELQLTPVVLRLVAALFACRCTLVWEEQTTLTGLRHLPVGMQIQQLRA